MILLLVSFLAGVLTILAPCTLPLLPVIVGSSVARAKGAGVVDSAQSSQRFKALTISLSLAVSVILFTLLLKFSTALIHIPSFIWPLISGSIIIIFGLTSLFPSMWEKIPGVSALNISSNKMLGVGYKKKGVLGDVIIGASLGPVFSTCSPTYFIILATVLPQSFWLGLTYLIAYAAGLAGMIMLVSILGQKLVDKIGGLSDSRGTFKKVIGVMFIILGVLILTGVDKVAERKLLDSGIFDITKFERSLLELESPADVVSSSAACEGGSERSCANKSQQDQLEKEGIEGLKKDQLNMVQGDSTTTQGANKGTSISAPKRLSGLPIAPELVKPDGYINTGGKEIKLADLKGNKIVLLDVWTYSCINCQRTLPYVNAWYEKYKDQGLEIIGLHTPEFSFEKLQTNVEREVQKFGIKYPVVLDNTYATWNAYGNRYWPRKYLINQYGEIIYDHIGEGGYEETEMQIQKALAGLNAEKLDAGKITSASIGSGNITDPKDKIVVDQAKVKSPEVYFGYKRNTLLANGYPMKLGVQNLVIPSPSGAGNASDVSNVTGAKRYDGISSNRLYLGGQWNFEEEYASAKSASVGSENVQPKIIFKYDSKNVYMVLSGITGGVAKVGVYVDGIKVKTIAVSDQQLYTIVEGADYGEHVLELRLESGELNAYTFTFG